MTTGTQRDSTSTDAVIRPANDDDLTALAEIYNHGVSDGNATFDEYPISSSRYKPLIDDPARCAILVADLAGSVVGWASLSPISERWAYRYTALGSLFVHKNYRHMGIGRLLKKAQIKDASRLGYHNIIAEVLSTNLAGIMLNLSFGGKIVGEIWEAGFRNGQWIGLVIIQHLLNTPSHKTIDSQ